jgi:hypothetical protein
MGNATILDGFLLENMEREKLSRSVRRVAQAATSEFAALSRSH